MNFELKLDSSNLAYSEWWVKALGMRDLHIKLAGGSSSDGTLG
jgi:hypothetical protein